MNGPLWPHLTWREKARLRLLALSALIQVAANVVALVKGALVIVALPVALWWYWAYRAETLAVRRKVRDRLYPPGPI